MSKNKENAVAYCETLNFNASDKSLNPVLINGDPYFVAAEVCEILDLQNPSDILKKTLEKDEYLTYTLYRAGQNRQVNLFNESGLYNLIFQSRKPEAKAFRKWVTSVVLPSIRKTGKFSVEKNRYRDSADSIDLRHIPYGFRSIENSPVRVINYEDIDWFSVNDVQRAIGASTGSNQVARRLNSFDDRTLAIKIAIYGNTHPAWFTSISGVKLIISGSRKSRNGKRQEGHQLQLTIGGLV